MRSLSPPPAYTKHAGMLDADEQSASSPEKHALKVTSSYKPRTELFVKRQVDPSYLALMLDQQLTKAGLSSADPSMSALYEFVFPAHYADVRLWPKLWRRVEDLPEYYVQLRPWSTAYASEPFIIARKVNPVATAYRPLDTTKQQQHACAVQIAASYRAQVCAAVERWTERMLERVQFCQRCFFTHYQHARRTDEYIWRRVQELERGEGPAGAEELVKRLEQYFEFVGRRKGDGELVDKLEGMVEDMRMGLKTMTVYL